MTLKHVDLTLPTEWEQVTRWQAIRLGRYFWKFPLRGYHLAKLLVELAGLTNSANWRKAQLIQKYGTAETVVLLVEEVRHLRWVVEELCFEKPKLRYINLGPGFKKLVGPSNGLRSMTYQQFFDYADLLCNEYILNRNPKVLGALLSCLYMPQGTRFIDDKAAEARSAVIMRAVSQGEQHAALNDFLAMRRWLFTHTDFAVLADFDQNADQDTPKSPVRFSDAVFALAKEDVTQMSQVRNTPLWDILEGLSSAHRKALLAKANQVFKPSGHAH